MDQGLGFVEYCVFEFSNGGGVPSLMRVAPIDGDDDVDVHLSFEHTDFFYSNEGDGLFEWQGIIQTLDWSTIDALYTDADNDGDLDVVLAQTPTLFLYRNDTTEPGCAEGTICFVEEPEMFPASGGGDKLLAQGDFNGDNLEDVVVMGYPSSSIWYNGTTGGFTQGVIPNTPPIYGMETSIALGDIDGDGDTDMVVGTTERNFVMLNVGGTFLIRK
jgi:hypothetical protein